jgi:hypothetical protein
MPIRYAWHDTNKQVILLTLEKNWSWDDYLQLQPKLFEMIDSVDTIVHYLIDARSSRGLPLGALNKLPAIFSQTHPRRGKTIILGANSAIRNLWDLLRKVIPQLAEPRYFFVASPDEAEALLLRLQQKEGQSSIANPSNKEENQV